MNFPFTPPKCTRGGINRASQPEVDQFTQESQQYYLIILISSLMLT